jgi:lysophospholipase L1-like esterase
MAARRWAGAAAGLLAVCAIVSGCSESSGAAGGTTTSPAHSFSIAALGDSVPRGTNCDCTPYPELSADGLSTTSGETVKAANDSVAGATTSTVLGQLASDEDVISNVRKADAVEVEIGANDVAYSSSCGTSVDCYSPRVPTMEKQLAEIVDRIHDLTAGHKVLVVLLDYWSVWLGGKYAAAHGPDYVAAAEEMTDRVDTAIKLTADSTGSAYVDLRAAFKGPSYSYDETKYLSDDGDHPNAAGHQKIADAVEAAIAKAKALPA